MPTQLNPTTWKEIPKDDDKDCTERNNRGQFVSGNIPFDRSGIPHTQETKRKLSLARKGRTPNKPKEMLDKKFNRLLVIERKEKRGSQYAWLCKCDCGKQIISGGYQLRSGQTKSCGCWTKDRMAQMNKENSGEKNYWYGKRGYYFGKRRPELSKLMSGKNNPNWRGGIKTLNKKIRDSIEYAEWRKSVFIRDNYTCQNCGQVGRNIHADHIKPFSLYPDLRFDLNNGRTLCIFCHRKTDTWGGKVYAYN